jgi:hypothetical protein
MLETAMSALERDALARYQALLGISHVLAGHRSRAELFTVLSNQLHLVVPFDYLALLLHDAASDEMRLVILEPPGSPPTVQCAAGFGRRPGGSCLEDSKGINHPDRFPRCASSHSSSSSGSKGRVTCWLPLTTSHARLGVLSFGSRKTSDYT